MDSLIAVGEIDTNGNFQVDSLFWHRENAERYARILLKRGAFRVAIDGQTVLLSNLARQMDIRAKQLSS